MSVISWNTTTKAFASLINNDLIVDTTANSSAVDYSCLGSVSCTVPAWYTRLVLILSNFGWEFPAQFFAHTVLFIQVSIQYTIFCAENLRVFMRTAVDCAIKCGNLTAFDIRIDVLTSTSPALEISHHKCHRPPWRHSSWTPALRTELIIFARP